MSDCGCDIEINSDADRTVLLALLGINGAMFAAELTAGIIFSSAGLIADSLDMLADAAVYAVSLYAVGKAVTNKIRAAELSGVLQLSLGFLVFIEVLRRFYFGSEPESTAMMVVGAIALVANFICLVLISKHRDGEVHMRASWIFSMNDVLANLGVIASGYLVALTGSNTPDLVIGIAISALVINGGRKILSEANDEKRHDEKYA